MDPTNEPVKPSEPADDKPAGPPQIDIEQFFRTDLRVARVLAAEPVPKTSKLLRLEVDLGHERRQLVAGLAEVYEPDALIGKNIIVVANLQPARIRGVESRGMLLAADVDGRPVVATFDESIPPGTRVR